ncbi:MAG: xanthine dehydrogenase family protein molybdopterin-binding subunit [Bryobacterales bacterium]|nr:xanthine dehydrogenase family protein molybdopterin-binding subunit [Bryobacterales bacterium]
MPTNKVNIPNYRLLGKNYTTPDMVAKVTGKSKYAEDFRAEGMLFCKLLLSPLPHGRVKRIDASAALAMPGVKAILTADELPPPAPFITDDGVMIPADPRAERGLTNEPLYQGEPVLAVAAVDELTAAEAIEKIQIDWERLPFAVDPMVTLKPGGPNARTDGNVWVVPPPAPPKPGEKPAGPPLPQVQDFKWTDAEYAEFKQGKLPMSKPSMEWSYGDIEAGFKKADLVVDEAFVTPNTSHQCMETRTAMAYWQNGKVFVHCSTQSTAQTVPAIARWLSIDQTNVVVISEYTGGGFGSKVTSGISLTIPVLLSKKVNAPVMMRVSREEEHYIGRARPGFHGRMKAGFTKDGRLVALDMFVVTDGGPYGPQGDANSSGRIVSLCYTPENMRWRGVNVITNTPPRGAQSQPGGAQGVMIMEPVMNKAANKLGLDQVAIRRINAPAGKAGIGGAIKGKRDHVTSAFVQEALDKGAELFRWNERKSQVKKSGTKARGIGVAVSAYSAGSIGFDGLFVIKPDGKIYIQSGVGNLGTESMIDSHRVVAEVLGVPWEQCVVTWGNTAKHLPWTCPSGGSQTIHAMTRAAHATAMDAKQKLQEIAAMDLGGTPADYEVGGGRVFRKGGGAGLTFAQAAQRAIKLGGKYDGHEVPETVSRMTKASVTGLAGQGLLAAAKDKYKRDGITNSYVAGFAEVEVDLETGEYRIVDYVGVADVGTVIHPRAFGGQMFGRTSLGWGHALAQKWVYDQHYGAPLAKRFYNSKPPTILDVPVNNFKWAAVDIPDPETPVGARGIGEPPVGAGASAVLNALVDALGENIFRRAPVTLDIILTALETGKPGDDPLTAHI